MTKESKYCECNVGELDHLPDPLFRLVCHSKTCQQFFGSAYNDECTFLLKDCPDVKLQQPFTHLYYANRQTDDASGVKKIGGHMLSEFAILVAGLRTIFR